MDRKEDGLKALGAKTQYRMDYAPEVLETFVNKHPGNDYWVRFNCPEFNVHHQAGAQRSVQPQHRGCRTDY